jgi:hypothetical protein
MTLTVQLPLPVSSVFVFYTLGQYWCSYSKPKGWISAFCTSIKKLAHQIVVSQFRLKKGCTDQVEELLKNHKYIFPTDNNVSASSWCCMSFLIFMSCPRQGPQWPTILWWGHCVSPQSNPHLDFWMQEKKYHTLMAQLYKAIRCISCPSYCTCYSHILC